MKKPPPRPFAIVLFHGSCAWASACCPCARPPATAGASASSTATATWCRTDRAAGPRMPTRRARGGRAPRAGDPAIGHVPHRPGTLPDAAAGHPGGVLPAAVPPDPGERCLVGRGLHRVDQRHPRPAAVRGARAAAPARCPGLLRPAREGRDAPADAAGTRIRHRRVLLLSLLVRRQAPAGDPGRDSGWTIRRWICRSACAGPTRTGRAAGTVAPTTSSSPSDTAPRTTWPSSPRSPATCAIRATCAWTASRCCWSTAPACCPMPPPPPGAGATWCRENGVGEILLACVQGFERPDPRDDRLRRRGRIPAQPGHADQHHRTPASDQSRLSRPGPGLARAGARSRRTARCRTTPCSPASTRAGTTNRAAAAAAASMRTPRRAATGTGSNAPSRTAHPSCRDAQRLVFINAWNEWAEGAVLEPDARLGHAWLDATRRRPAVAAGGPAPAVDPRPCAVIHAWYPELLDEIARRPCAPAASTGASSSPPRTSAKPAVRDAPGTPATWTAELHAFPNRGRDVLPFLHVANRLLDEGVETVAQTAHQALHAPRRRRAPGARTARTPAGTARARGPSATPSMPTPVLGLVAAEGHVQPLHATTGAPTATAVQPWPCRWAWPSPTAERDRFVAGSMFWLRLDALRPLLDAHLDPGEFEPEAGQVDGTLAHAIERVVALAVRAAGFGIDDAARICGRTRAGRPLPLRPPRHALSGRT